MTENSNAEQIIRKGQNAAAKGFANEQRFLAALLSRGYNASKVDLPNSSYDIIIELSPENIIRAQVKTVSPSESISFKGGVRGGADKIFKSGEKEYVQSTKTSDLVVGVRCEKDNGDIKIDFYFVPTLWIEKLNQKSISINRIPQSKNAWNLLKNCKDKKFVEDFFIS